LEQLAKRQLKFGLKKKLGLSAGESLGKGKVGTEELSGRGKGDSLKIELVAELRKQTAM
jgi:hypothetical protein